MKHSEQANKTRLIIPKPLWRDLIYDLRKRGNRVRESGAFLLGQNDRRTISEYICYDDLDSKSFDKGYIYFTSEAYGPLWDYCLKHKVKVLADIHTHPKSWTGQSTLDKTHPTIPVKGHIGLIVPHFATRNLKGLKGVGIHEYEGNFTWTSWDEKGKIIKLI